MIDVSPDWLHTVTGASNNTTPHSKLPRRRSGTGSLQQHILGSAPYDVVNNPLPRTISSLTVREVRRYNNQQSSLYPWYYHQVTACLFLHKSCHDVTPSVGLFAMAVIKPLRWTYPVLVILKHSNYQPKKDRDFLFLMETTPAPPLIPTPIPTRSLTLTLAIALTVTSNQKPSIIGRSGPSSWSPAQI